jgi:hypothetical protein
MNPESPEHKMILMGIISNTGLQNRAKLVQMLEQSIQTAQQMAQLQANQATQQAQDPLTAQLQQVNLQLEIEEKKAKIAELQARTALQTAKAQNEAMEPQYRSMEIATKGIYAVQEQRQEAEFNRRMQIADKVLQKKDIESNERIAAMQTQGKVAAEAVKARGADRAARHNARSTVASEAVKAMAAPAEPQPMPARPRAQMLTTQI